MPTIILLFHLYFPHCELFKSLCLPRSPREVSVDTGVLPSAASLAAWQRVREHSVGNDAAKSSGSRSCVVTLEMCRGGLIARLQFIFCT